MHNTVSDQLVDMVARAGIKRIYGIVGDSLNPVMDALHRDERLRWVHVRHEETAAFAASAEAQLTGRTAACCGSCGPGNMHLINGLYDAHHSHAPVLAVASHIPVPFIGTRYFQETHPTRFFNECTAYRELVSVPAQAPAVVGEALRAAAAKQDVGMVVLPGDVAALPAAGQVRGIPAPAMPRAALQAAPTVLAHMAQLINAAPRVTFLCGAGCAAAREAVIALAKKVQAPIAYTLRGKEFMEHDNPLAIGMTGLLGWGAAPQAVFECDLLVIWGADFPYADFLPAGGNVIQVDTSATALGRRVPVALGVRADVADTARALLPLIATNRDGDFLTAARERHSRALQLLHQHIRRIDESAPLRPELLTRLISDYAEPDTVFTVDTGTPVIWAARYLRGGGTRRIIGSFRYGSMACALGMAIGAKATFPTRQVVALCGDGGFSMAPGDLLTLVQEGLAVKVCVYNNSSLEMVAMEQRAKGMEPRGTQLLPTDFARMAAGMGVPSFALRHPCEALSTIKAWLAAKGPALLDATVDPHALPLPPDMERLHAQGYCSKFRSHSRSGYLDTLKRLLFGNRLYFR